MSDYLDRPALMSAVRKPTTSTDSPRASTPLTHHSAPAIAPINQNRPSTTKTVVRLKITARLRYFQRFFRVSSLVTPIRPVMNMSMPSL